MTPKEKAIELVESMTFHCYECGGSDNAKQCALVAVDEILKNNCGSYTDESSATNNEIYCDEYYWQQVRKEIESL